jgi:hypothetical protein
MKRIYPSGAQKKKLSEEKKQKENVLLDKIPKLGNYFATSTSKNIDELSSIETVSDQTQDNDGNNENLSTEDEISAAFNKNVIVDEDIGESSVSLLPFPTDIIYGITFSISLIK